MSIINRSEFFSSYNFSKDLEIGFTSGAFDLIHAGHISFLKQAKKQCDILIVGINSDSSIKQYKDLNRPIIPIQERLLIINELKSVDYVFSFDEINNFTNLQEIRPTIFFKGADRDPVDLLELPWLKMFKIKLGIIQVEYDIHTTTIIERIKDV